MTTAFGEHHIGQSDTLSEPFVPHNRPLITDADRRAACEVLRSPWIAGGREVAALEAAVDSLYVGGGSCGVSSGTAALYLALTVLGVGAKDVVAVPTYSCSALLDAVFAVGAEPLVVDVSAGDFTLDPGALERATRTLRRPLAACIAVHTHGARARLDDLVAAGSGTIVEDCCHSLGGRHEDRLIGGEGAISVFSFFATKIVTCGHGGLLHSPVVGLAEAARDFRDSETRPHYRPRFNVHLTDFQAAMVRSQLQRLHSIAETRRSIADRYLRALPPGVEAEPASIDDDRLMHRFILRAIDGKQRAAFAHHFAQHGIEARAPICREDLLHRYMRLDPADFPVSEQLAETTLSVPLYPALTEAQTATVCEALATVPH
jgi:dTDP-4-amino-4,6-dideoxygalactose transaminase